MLLLICVLLFPVVCGCDTGGKAGSETGSADVSGGSGSAADSGVTDPVVDPAAGPYALCASDPSAPLHEQLIAESRNHAASARFAYDAGESYVSAYYYALAQGEISSLRMCVDTILWLKGEGSKLDDVIGTAPYWSWDKIVEAGMPSPMPVYFEGLLYRIQGETDKAEELFADARLNPLYTERDFYYLKSLSVSELYAVRAAALAQEEAVFIEYTPVTRLCSCERTGGEFSADFHWLLMDAALHDNDIETAYQCALNALVTTPQDPRSYAAAVNCAMYAGHVKECADLCAEALWMYPEDGYVNYICGIFLLAADEEEQGIDCLNKAVQYGSDEVKAAAAEILKGR